MTHELLPGFSAEELAHQLVESKKLLEDIMGAPVLGFRAPNLSGYPDGPQFFDLLQSAGYRYDSSFTGACAAKMLGQSEPGFTVAGTNGGILEFPVTMTGSILFKMPMGGTFLKLMTPYGVSRRVTRNNRENKPAVLYFHTYEVAGDPICWAHPSPSLRARVSIMLRNPRKGHHLEVLNYLFSYHSFTSIKNYLDRMENS
jgi:peptidoglycan/xylan/chitin deacetylase (PgdA/CDA1 family)